MSPVVVRASTVHSSSSTNQSHALSDSVAPNERDVAYYSRTMLLSRTCCYITLKGASSASSISVAPASQSVYTPVPVWPVPSPSTQLASRGVSLTICSTRRV
eukprot:8342-Heterococcus_DN1.PRE.1